MGPRLRGDDSQESHYSTSSYARTMVESLTAILYSPRNLAACLLAGGERKNSNSWGGSRDAMHSRVEIDRNWHWYFDCTRDRDLRTGRRSKRALAWGWRKAM